MNLKQIQEKALNLSEQERAILAQKLILSLEEQPAEEISEEWFVEANRRAIEIDQGIVLPISAEETRRKVQALLR